MKKTMIRLSQEREERRAAGIPETYYDSDDLMHPDVEVVIYDYFIGVSSQHYTPQAMANANAQTRT